MSELIIGFTGTQRGMTEKQISGCVDFLGSLLKTRKPENLLVVHGDCVGADYEFDSIAKEFGIPRVVYPANIPMKRANCQGVLLAGNPASPLVRNQYIVQAASCMLAAPKEMVEVLRSGTWATVRYTRKINKPLYVFYPE